MLKALLIDDEPNALDVLEMQLMRYCKNVSVLCKCTSGATGIDAIKALKPDLVFLDIEMPFKNGFDVLNETKEIEYDVIFTTAYNHFAIKAFKYATIDYLLKPIDIDELIAATEKAEKQKGKMGMNEKIQMLMTQLSAGNTSQPQKIALNTGDSFQLVDIDEIIRCESDSNYTHVFLKSNKKITVARTLKDIEATLDGLVFFRIHQSHLINMNHINKFIKSDGGYVVMSDGSNLTISRSRKELFLEKFRKI